MKKKVKVYQVYIFSKRRSHDIWSRESFRLYSNEISKKIKDYKSENRKLGYTQFKVIKLPVKER